MLALITEPSGTLKKKYTAALSVRSAINIHGFTYRLIHWQFICWLEYNLYRCTMYPKFHQTGIIQQRALCTKISARNLSAFIYRLFQSLCIYKAHKFGFIVPLGNIFFTVPFCDNTLRNSVQGTQVQMPLVMLQNQRNTHALAVKCSQRWHYISLAVCLVHNEK